MSDDLDAIQAIFFEECSEGLVGAEAGLAAMADGDVALETIAGVFRAVHSIKGGSGAFGHAALLAFSHRFENVLDEVRAGRIAPTQEVVRQLLSAFDILSDHVAAAREGTSPPEDAGMLAALDAVLATKGVAEVSEQPADDSCSVETALSIEPLGDEFDFAPVTVSLDDLEPAAGEGWSVLFKPSRGALANGAEPLLVIRELERLGGRVVEPDLTALPPLRELDIAEGYAAWTVSVPASVAEADIRECFDFVPPEAVIEIYRQVSPSIVPEVVSVNVVEQSVALPASIAGSDAPAERKPVDRGEMTIRVDLSKLDSLLNLVGELVIRNSILADRLSPQDQERVELSQLSRLTRQIQDSVMSLRAQPIKQAFSRVPRMLRDLSAETGKAVRLEVTGESTEVDKRVIERIGDPLTHMIRNAVDHGIESADQRVAAGKPKEGLLRLSAEQKGGRIIVRVADDGGGIDRDRVRAKAVDKGIISADSQLTSEEIDQLICAPGFSTAETISNISGRGVGMDVVRSNVEALGGRVEISSVPGERTTFSMILPLTLAILDGMIVRMGGERYVLPLATVVESVQPGPGQVQAMTPDQEVIELRGSYLPITRLGDFFGIRSDHSRNPEDNLVIVVESDTAGHVGLMVETIDDRREVVIKSLDKNLYPIRGLGGATVLGDGSIALILDLETIVATATSASARNLKGLAA